MDIRNIYVIVGKKFTKELVVEEIKSEGYKHNFLFGQSVPLPRGMIELENTVRSNLAKCDEVWCFGDCAGDYHYELAKFKGADIWYMG